LQTLPFSQVWSGGNLRANYNLHHVDPTVQSIAFKLTAIQVKRLTRQAVQ
jgi:hypothetical protein